MTGFAYDAVETDDAVQFVAVCPAPPARPVATRLVPGRGIELTCGRWTLRAGNLHPELTVACGTKRVSVVAVCDVGVVARGPAGVEPPLWRSDAFLWYLDPHATTTEDLAKRPLPRAIALATHAVVLATLGAACAAPVALCASRPAMAVLPPGRRWTRVCGGLLVDDSVLAGSVDAAPLAEPIGDRVAVGMRAQATPRRAGASWRPQIAVLSSGA